MGVMAFHAFAVGNHLMHAERLAADDRAVTGCTDPFTFGIEKLAMV